MRDVSSKQPTLRIASATAILRVAKQTLKRIHDQTVPKGDPLPVARVAAIQAAKQTSNIIPYCHPIPIEWASCEFELDDKIGEIRIHTQVKAVHKTGVEMEALTAAGAAALTLYDVLKPIDDGMEIASIRLTKKEGGKSDFRITDLPIRAAVVVISDSVSQGKREDRSGILIKQRLREENVGEVIDKVVSDDPKAIESVLRELSDSGAVDIVLTTGGTGLGPRDNTPEVTKALIERELPGISETLRSYGQERTPFSMLSRGMAGVRGTTLIVNLPGSPKGVQEGLDVLFPAVKHALKMMRGEGHPTR
ncbi:MAG TPA: bifunctional molybdenum cofactor biosynthesis protein MoaC/MoaB [Bacteroidota bacterium]|nr:bifunctional molybdenum cofactor biosynthesis protein MoaC/MoaB [Bacteroidota bacterium]